MADAENSGPEVAAAFFEAVLKQSELVGSWSLAVFGACVVLLAWNAQRRLDKQNAPGLRALPFVIACGGLQGISILLMYLAYGQMVTLIPAVQFAKFDSAAAFEKLLTEVGFDAAQILFACQFAGFFLGVALLGVFALSNYRLVGDVSETVSAPAAPPPPPPPSTAPQAPASSPPTSSPPTNPPAPTGP
jgi:hypothetical protein